ncbi:MAG: hypothetical protein RLZZ369_790 [Pseudomonadota bacterium]
MNTPKRSAEQSTRRWRASRQVTRSQGLVQTGQLAFDRSKSGGCERVTLVISHRGIQADGQSLTGSAPRLEWRLGLSGLGDVKSQHQFTQGGLIRVIRKSGLSIKMQGQNGRCALFCRWQDQTTRQSARHKSMAHGLLLHVAYRPSTATRIQTQGQLRVMRASKVVQLFGVGNHIQHVGEHNRATEYSISFKAPVRLASKTPACNSL